jgi:hypothetical protein
MSMKKIAFRRSDANKGNMRSYQVNFVDHRCCFGATARHFPE